MSLLPKVHTFIKKWLHVTLIPTPRLQAKRAFEGNAQISWWFRGDPEPTPRAEVAHEMDSPSCPQVTPGACAATESHGTSFSALLLNELFLFYVHWHSHCLRECLCEVIGSPETGVIVVGCHVGARN